MLFEITLIKFDTSESLGVDAVLDPVCFTIFIFICLSIFLSIINENFRRPRDQRNDGDEMLSFIQKKFLRCTGKESLIRVEIVGLKKPTPAELQEELDRRMRSQYFHSIDNFSDRVDQLLEKLTRVRYINSQ